MISHSSSLEMWTPHESIFNKVYTRPKSLTCRRGYPMLKKLFPNSMHWNKEVGEPYTHVVLDVATLVT